jgi:hypothetical protein
MSCCCKKIYKICDVIICDELDLILPIPVVTDGEHTLELDFLNNVLSQSKEFATGQSEMRFSKSDLNEAFTYVGHVKGPDGAIVTFDIDGVTFDCVEFTTRRNLQSSTSNESGS